MMINLAILGSGSAGNAVCIEYKGESILIDAGFSGIELQRRLQRLDINPESIKGILISHEHDDHSQGLRIFCRRHGQMPAYMNALTAESLRFLKRIPENVRIFQNGSPFQLGRFQVEAFSLSHDAVDPVGFIVHCDDRKIAIATDFGYAGKMVPLKMYNADIIILESNHEPELLRRSKRPPKIQHRIHGRRGHLSNPSAAALLQQIVGPLTRQLVMVHLSRDCNHPNLVKDRMQSSLQCLERNDIDLHIAEQDKIVKTVLD